MTVTSEPGIVVTPMAGRLGARLDGVDISRLTDEDWTTVQHAFATHSVIALSDQQRCSTEEYTAFASRWGDLMSSRGGPVPVGSSAMFVLEDVKPNFTDIWHTDMSYLPRPPLATILLAVDVPAAGGDTIFASQVSAYEALSDGYRQLLSGLQALHVEIPRGDGVPFEERRRAVHPVVRHVDDVASLYVNGMYTHQIVDMTYDESRPILEWLFAHCTQPNFTYRHTWRVGDIVIWDNRRVQHFAVHDYGEQHRRMHRVVVADPAARATEPATPAG